MAHILVDALYYFCVHFCQDRCRSQHPVNRHMRIRIAGANEDGRSIKIAYVIVFIELVAN